MKDNLTYANPLSIPSIPMSCAHIYERRIGMDRIEADENGELYCPDVTETPQFAPCVVSFAVFGTWQRPR